MPFYNSIPLLRTLYQDAFPHIIICGTAKSGIYDVLNVNLSKGYFAYECLGEAIRRNPGFNGYLYINDDVIINWWNLVKFDKSKVWQGSSIGVGVEISSSVKETPKNWIWWKQKVGLSACKAAFEDINAISHKHGLPAREWNVTGALEILLKNGNGTFRCGKGWSDIFYVPSRYAAAYSDLSAIFYKRRVFLEIAATTILSMLDLRSNNIKLNGIYLPDIGIMNGGLPAVVHFRPNATFIHPYKLNKKGKVNVNKAVLRNFMIPFSKELTSCLLAT